MLTTFDGRQVNLMFGTGLSSEKDYLSLKTIIEKTIEVGIVGFDTAPSYGTEEVLGKCVNEILHIKGIQRDALFIQTKIDAWQMVESKDKICNHIESVINRLGIEYLDSLLIHWPVPEHMIKTWECLIKMKKEGKVRNIGICNLRMRHLVRLFDYDEVPSIIQLERNPLRICNNEVTFCHDNNITLQSYSPLCKMHPDIANSRVLSIISKKYNKSVGQIVLRWHIDTGTIPIFTSKKITRIEEYAKIFDFCLDKMEVDQISSLNRDYKMYLEACACPGY